MSETLQKSDSLTDEKFSLIGEIIFVLLCTMLVVSTVAFGSVDVWALGLNAFFAGLVAVFWTVDALVKKEFRFNASLLQIPILALILIGLIQLLPLRSLNFSADLLSVAAANSLSLAPYVTRLAIVQLVIYFIFFAAAQTYISNENRLRKIVVTIIGFASLMAFFGILQQLASVESIYGLRTSDQAVPFASFINRHHFASFMEMTMGLTLGLLFGKATRSNKRVFLVIAVVIMGMALVLTNSRGGMISLLAVVGFIVVVNVRQKPIDEPESATEPVVSNRQRNIIYIGGGLILILVLFGAVLLLGGDESLLRGVGLSNPNEVSNGRFHFWQIAWQIFLENPILGAGLDSYGTIFPHYDSWNGILRIEQAHNDYLQTLADAGILGFACVAAVIYLLFKKSQPIIGKASDRFGRGAATGAIAGCFGILVHSFFDFPLRTPSNALFFLTLTVIATNLLSPHKISRKRRIHYARTNL
ncbi:MAG: O-antigen ligase family protein [Pyrinomonadaceae bacterium]|nr:O-antigen ligase family protein [Pyrinomonadaceae bacterium]